MRKDSGNVVAVKYRIIYSFWVVVTIGWVAISCGRLKENEKKPEPPPPQYIYGIQSDSFFIINDTI